MPDAPPLPSTGTVAVPQVGELTVAWRVALVATWIGAFVAYMAVWKISEEIGIGTWWLGPRSDPQPIVVRLIPFLVTASCGALASVRLRHTSLISLVGAGALGLIAVPDVSRASGIAWVEMAIAGAVALVALASFTGRYRAPSPKVAG